MKKIIIIFILIFSSFFAFSQEFEQWTKDEFDMYAKDNIGKKICINDLQITQINTDGTVTLWAGGFQELITNASYEKNLGREILNCKENNKKLLVYGYIKYDKYKYPTIHILKFEDAKYIKPKELSINSSKPSDFTKYEKWTKSEFDMFAKDNIGKYIFITDMQITQIMVLDATITLWSGGFQDLITYVQYDNNLKDLILYCKKESKYVTVYGKIIKGRYQEPTLKLTGISY